jgi:hypothetical protein
MSNQEFEQDLLIELKLLFGDNVKIDLDHEKYAPLEKLQNIIYIDAKTTANEIYNVHCRREKQSIQASLIRRGISEIEYKNNKMHAQNRSVRFCLKTINSVTMVFCSTGSVIKS